MTNAALHRFNELRQSFRAMVPPANNINRKRRRELSWAASLEQVRETAALERELGATHDRNFIKALKAEVRQHLVLAGARFDQGRK